MVYDILFRISENLEFSKHFPIYIEQNVFQILDKKLVKQPAGTVYLGRQDSWARFLAMGPHQNMNTLSMFLFMKWILSKSVLHYEACGKEFERRESFRMDDDIMMTTSLNSSKI